MNLSKRIDLLVRLGEYMQQSSEDWLHAKEKAYQLNAWFLPEFIDKSAENIASRFLEKAILEEWIAKYPAIKEENPKPKLLGIVMAGNIPLVGFHDMLCVFISGNKSLIKTSSKDEVLIKHLAKKLIDCDAEVKNYIAFADMLRNCDAYIATGSNNTAGYFEYYFGKYPHIIRRNRTSVAILTGKESDNDLASLADDVYYYFGMGCRNVTKIYVPMDYDFERLLNIFKKYNYLAGHNKYKNNYDYNLALHILNNKKYMSNDCILLVEDNSIFSPISQLHFETYDNIDTVIKSLKGNESVQCIIGENFVSFGKAQIPGIIDYADGVDVMNWLQQL